MKFGVLQMLFQLQNLFILKIQEMRFTVSR
jgi:hypothetical protein